MLLSVEAGEEVYITAFDMEEIRAYRECEVGATPSGGRYGLLTSLEVEEPLRRVDAVGEAYDRAKR